MANTKTISGSGSRGYSAYLYLTETGTDVTTNKSTISYSLVLYSGNYSFSQYELGWSVYINGTRVAYQNYSGHQDSISANSSKTLASGTTTVTHEDDGSKTISVSAYVDCVYGSYGPGDIDLGSSTWQLTAIPRASSISLSNGTLGTSQNITITPAVASYTHTLTYSCGSTSGTIASGISGSTSGFTQAWTPPLSLASQNTTGTSVSVTVRCETFYNSTSVGSKSVTVTMAMPASIKPSVSMTLSDAIGYLSTYGAYIQNKSKLGVVVNATASYGSAISSYSVKIGTRLTYTSGNFTSDVLPESGSISVVATVTDKRGRSNSATNTITVAAYSAPSITDIGIYRSNSSGTASATGTYATVTFKASVSPIAVSGTNKNTAAYTLRSKLSTASSYGSTTLSAYANNFNVTNGKTTFSAAAANAYDAYITIADKFGTVSSIVVRVQSAAAYFKADPVNNAFSFGQLGVTASTFTCAWAAVFNSTVSIGDVGDLKTAFNAKLSLSGGTMTGKLTLQASQNADSYSTGALDAKDSNLIGVNAIYFAATGGNQCEGINFYRSSTKTDTLYANSGTLYFVPNRTVGSTGTAQTVLHTGNITGTIKDYITERGTSGNWTYEKWNSGKAVCWGTHTKQTTSWSAWGSVYEQSMGRFTYPTNLFIARPTLNINLETDGWGVFGPETWEAGSKTQTPQIGILRPDNSGSGAWTVYIHIHAIGKWK